MRIYLKVLAALYFAGFIFHAADLFDARLRFSEMDSIWKTWILFLAAADLAAAVGLWRGKRFGEILFVLVAVCQLFAYLCFKSFFGNQTFLVIFHFVTLAVYFGFRGLHEYKLRSGPRSLLSSADEKQNDAVENAKRFLTCAKESEQIAPNVAYVLATTALEEVGKSLLKKQKLLEKYSGKPNPSWLAKHEDDHQKKLFWAIWTPMLGNKVITGKDFVESKELASSIHNKRLRAQYSDDGHSTQLAVNPEEVRNLIQFTDARIKIEESYKPIDPDPERVEKMRWFLGIHEAREDSKLIFGGRSMQKLSELGDVYLWVCWLKDQFDEADQDAIRLSESELNREIDKTAEKKIKWKMTVKLVSKSHSIRPGEFAKWNETVEQIKIRAGDPKKREILVDFFLPEQFHIKTLWWQSHALVNHFLIALNIGTFGYFWWYVPTITERFYEKLEDLENKSEVRIENHPNKPIVWGNLALKKDDLNRVAICLPFIYRSKETKIFDHYLTGLGFLAKTDVVMRFDANALEAFARALQLIVEKYREIPLIDFLARPTEAIGAICSDWKEEDRNRITELVGWAFSDKRNTLAIEQEDVGIMKILTDNILQELARNEAREHFSGKKSEAPSNS
ncbi:MAG TPA: AbiV family abortive infection protein [Pseudobdellovibrionaceae bacterium]